MNLALKIISGGQTGADRAALDAAQDAGIDCGGWCPANREAEDGIIPDRYSLTPLAGAGYDERTTKNVIDSDGTIVFARRPVSGGTRFTFDECRRVGKPVYGVNVETCPIEAAIELVCGFVRNHGLRVLNIAGPRASEDPDVGPFVYEVMRQAIERLRSERS